MPLFVFFYVPKNVLKEPFMIDYFNSFSLTPFHSFCMRLFVFFVTCSWHRSSHSSAHQYNQRPEYDHDMP